MMGRIDRWCRGGRLAAILLAGTLAGCAGEDMSDLRSYVKKVEARKGGRIEPLPEFKTYENYAYATAGRRDPFQPIAEPSPMEEQGQAEGPGITPDLNRRKETLEGFPLDALDFVGHMQRDGEEWALITDPEGLVHRVQVGNYLGQNHGEIHTITETKVMLTEIVPDGSGGWVEREAALALSSE